MGFPRLGPNSKTLPAVNNILLAHKNEQYIQNMFFPEVIVDSEFGELGAISSDHMRSWKTERSLYDESEHRMKFEYTRDKKYQIVYHDLSVRLPNRLIDQVDKPFKPMEDAAMALYEAMLLKRELLIAEQVTNTNVMTLNETLAGADQFHELSTSQPEVVIQDGISTVRARIGRRPNRLMIGYNVLQVLKRHPWVVNQYNGLKTVGEEAVLELLKTHFRLKSVMVGEALEVGTKQGQTSTFSDVWGNDIVLFYAPDNPSLFAPSFGYSFRLKGNYLRTVLHEERKAKEIEIEAAYQDFIVDTNAGFLLKDCVETPNL